MYFTKSTVRAAQSHSQKFRRIGLYKLFLTVTDDRKIICRPPLLLLFFLTSLFSVLRLQLQRKTRCVCLRDIALCKPNSRAA